MQKHNGPPALKDIQVDSLAQRVFHEGRLSLSREIFEHLKSMRDMPLSPKADVLSLIASLTRLTNIVGKISDTCSDAIEEARAYDRTN